MPTAADIKNYVKPEVAPLYTYSAEIDTKIGRAHV